MNNLKLVRYAILIMVRDLLIPCGGLYLAIAGLADHSLQPWQLPLIAGMLGTPLIARGGGDDPPAPLASPEPPPTPPLPPYST